MANELDETAIPAVDLPRAWLHVDKAILLATKVLVCAVGVTFTVMVALEVASRYLLSTSMPQTNAVARFLLVWFFMLGAGLALRQGAHVGLDMLRRSLSPLGAAVISLLAQMLAMTFLLQMVWSGYLALGASFAQVEGSLGVSMAWVMSAFPVGFTLLIYHQTVLVFDMLRRLAGGAAAR